MKFEKTEKSTTSSVPRQPKKPRRKFMLVASTLSVLAAVFLAAPNSAQSSPAQAGSAQAGPSLSASISVAEEPSVIERRVIGQSQQDRAITAYRMGDPGEKVYVFIAVMHGNEPAGRTILNALRKGPAIHGIDLWLLPVYNPDGLSARTRKNARGVDLNRNFPYHWKDLDGNYESGSGPASEPETKAALAFLKEIKPHRLISFHQPLLGVDVDTKKPQFARRVARALRLPTVRLDCGGVCHGTMTGWYNDKFDGAAITVEYGPNPPRQRLKVQAPNALIKLLGGTRG